MTRLKMLAVLCLCLAASGQCVVWFESSWNQETGNSEVALTDGARWSRTNGSNVYQMLKAETGGVAGNNLMGIWLDNANYAHVQINYLPIQQNDDFYYRFYVRVYPKNGIKYPNFHGIQNYDYDYPSNFYFSVRDNGTTTSWSCAIGTYAVQTNDQMAKHYEGGQFEFDRWYRVEGHIKWFNHADWAAPVIWNLKVYDDANNVVLSEKDLKGMGTGISLQAYYDQGKKYIINGTTYTWAMGSNGPFGGTGKGCLHDVSCVALGSDSSIFGPVTGKVASVDNIKPVAENIFPKAGATDVLATTLLSLYVKEIGFGLDTASLIMRVNAQTVKPTLSGTIWNSKVLFKPPAGLPAGEKVTIQVTAKDKANPANSLDTTYSFTVAGVSAVRPMSAAAHVMENSDVTFYSITGQRLHGETFRPVHNMSRNAVMPYYGLHLDGKSSQRKLSLMR